MFVHRPFGITSTSALEGTASRGTSRAADIARWRKRRDHSLGKRLKGSKAEFRGPVPNRSGARTARAAAAGALAGIKWTNPAKVGPELGDREFELGTTRAVDQALANQPSATNGQFPLIGYGSAKAVFPGSDAFLLGRDE
jgi:hypothetical protein